jgi:2-polyprenyl-6-methoxyphenol hydroxylase-like FAD-dependent oxidoreductase
MTSVDFDVLQVGSGPVGLVMAALTGQRGHSIAVIERHQNLYNLPRAGHVDHEIMRTLQSLGVADTVAADAYPCNQYVWQNAAGEVLLDFPWGSESDSGWHSDYMMYQPVLEDALYSHNVDDEKVTFFRGWEAVEFRELDNGYEVTLARMGVGAAPGELVPTGERKVLRGRFLVGADGANSAVRTWLGIERKDIGFNERWLDVDMRRHRPISLDFDMGQICDPARPLFVAPLGKRHRRFEWALLPGESPEEMSRPEAAWKLLGELGLSSEDVSIVRQHVYTFEARVAEQWRRGGAFLVGDAAHTMPPHMGQGMCSGIRDATNLAWKLDLVLRGQAEDRLLDSYETERQPHVKDWTTISIEAGKVSCTLDKDLAAERDAAFREGYVPPIPEVPVLRRGVVQRTAEGAVAAPAGHLSPQARVRVGDTVGRFDDIVGGGWIVLSMAADPLSVLDAPHRNLLERLGAKAVHLVPNGEGTIQDADGRYAAYLAEWDWRAVVFRPDFYVFGGVTRLGHLPQLLDELAAQLDLRGGTDQNGHSVTHTFDTAN